MIPTLYRAACLLLALAQSPLAPAGPAAEAADRAAIVRMLVTAESWTVRWTLTATGERFAARVKFEARGGELYARTWHPDGSPCYAEIRVPLQPHGFVFFGCTGVPKEMRFDPHDGDVPFKGNAFGYGFRWTRGTP